MKQKEADKHDTADGENGRCAYSYDAQSYYCMQRGFVCIDEMVCADHRTAEEMAEDEALRVGKKRKVKRVAVIVDGIFGGVIGVALGRVSREGTGQERQAGRDQAEQALEEGG